MVTVNYVKCWLQARKQDKRKKVVFHTSISVHFFDADDTIDGGKFEEAEVD